MFEFATTGSLAVSLAFCLISLRRDVRWLGLFVVGPVLDTFGTEPVMIAFAAIQTLMMGLAALACIWVRPREAATPVPAGST